MNKKQTPSSDTKTKDLIRKVSPVGVRISVEKNTRSSKKRSRVITFFLVADADPELVEEGIRFFQSHGVENIPTITMEIEYA